MEISTDRQQRARENLARTAHADDDTATALLVEAIELDPSPKDAYLVLGRLYRRTRQLRAELALWNRRAELDASDEDAAERIGWILWFTGRAAEALPWLERSIELSPASPWNRFYVGNANLRLRNFPAAEAAYRGAFELQRSRSPVARPSRRSRPHVRAR